MTLLGIFFFIFVITAAALFINDYITLNNFLNYLWVIPLTIAALFQERIKIFLISPKLKIEFKLDAPYCLKTLHKQTVEKVIPMGGTFHQELASWDAYYFRFRVKNVGKIQARFCECIIEKLWLCEDNKWIQDTTFQAINLNWSNAKSEDEFLHINPRFEGWYCDLVHIEKNTFAEGLVFDYKLPCPNSQYRKLKTKINHKVDISVYSENAKPIRSSFLIQWSGNWKDEPEHMYKELVVKKL